MSKRELTSRHRLERKLDWQARLLAGPVLGAIAGVALWLLVALFAAVFLSSTDHSVGVDPSHPVLDQAGASSGWMPSFVGFWTPTFVIVTVVFIVWDYRNQQKP